MRTAQGRVKERALYNGILIRQQSDGKKPKQKEKKSSAFFLSILSSFFVFYSFWFPLIS
jgi:hypothetical protein